MKRLKLSVLLSAILYVHSYGQSGEMDKFYSYYKVNSAVKKGCDSVYNLIEQRRSSFSKSFRAYKEKNNDSPAGFVYDWAGMESEVLASLKKKNPLHLKHLIYYSYFDLSYGVYGLQLNTSVCSQAIKEIPASSAIWAMEPSLLNAVIKAAGGEEKCKLFIKKMLLENKDANLVDYVKRNLSASRPLMIGKKLPSLRYRAYSDTSKIITTDVLKGKYLLIDIWATWCKPCIDELPGLLKAYQSKNPQLEFLSISIDKYAVTSLKFTEEKIKIPWQKGAAVTSKDILDTLMINGIPCTILVSPEGNILSFGYALRGVNLEKTLGEMVK